MSPIRMGTANVKGVSAAALGDRTTALSLALFSGADELVCTLHGWRFDCATGRCLTAADRPIRIRRSD